LVAAFDRLPELFGIGGDHGSILGNQVNQSDLFPEPFDAFKGYVVEVRGRAFSSDDVPALVNPVSHERG